MSFIKRPPSSSGSARSPRTLAVLFLTILAGVFAQAAVANPVVIQDASFDNRSLNPGSFNTTLTPWQETNGPGNGAGFIERSNAFAADGLNHLGMNLNHNVWQDLGVTYQANTRYTLTVSAGNRSGTHTHAGNQTQYVLADSTGGIHATGTFNASTIPIGSFANAPALVFETTTRSPAVGRSIRVQLQARGSGRSHFDRIRLTAESTLPPLASTLAATSVSDTGATLHGSVNARNPGTTVSFEFGPTTAYGSRILATPTTVWGTSTTGVSAVVDGLPAGTTLHYRVVATNEAGTTHGENLTFTTESPAYLSVLAPSDGTLVPPFAPTVTEYSLQVPPTLAAIRLTPASQNAGSTLRVQGAEVASGSISAPIALDVGNTVIEATATAPGSSFAKTYRITVTRPPAAFTFTSPAAPAIRAAAFDASGLAINLSLGFAPAPGTRLTVVDATGGAFITGEFANLRHGQSVNLTHNGIIYPFEVNHFGGDGNDLTLEWANVRALAWGSNEIGQLGIGTLQNSLTAAAVRDSGILTGKRIVALSAGGRHSLALCSDGTLATWGANDYGQLGNDSVVASAVPVAVDLSGALAGKRVISISAGYQHNLVVCSDGTVVGWGANDWGQLGVNDLFSFHRVPIAVIRSGPLANRTVAAVAAGHSHSLALCSDGTLAAWGYNFSGNLGDGTNTDRRSPVAVIQTGALAGRRVLAIAAGINHSMALLAGGGIATWGRNNEGQLGIGSTENRAEPVMVSTTTALYNKTVTAVAATDRASFALCSDNTLVAWGDNRSGQLGNATPLQSPMPVVVTVNSALAGGTITGIGGGSGYAHAHLTNGNTASWGDNTYGQLGNGTTVASGVPVATGRGAMWPDERPVAHSAGFGHVLTLAAAVPGPLADSLTAADIHDQGATLQASVNPNGSSTAVAFEYGPTPALGQMATAVPAQLTGTGETPVAAVLAGLLPGKAYHFRVVATSAGGVRNGEILTFTTTAAATLSGLAADAGSLNPPFQAATSEYSLTVAPNVASIRFTPALTTPGATVTVGGVAVAPGAPSAPLPLVADNNPVAVVVTSPGGTNSFTYTVNVTRIPQVFAFDSATGVGARARAFDIDGMNAGFSLGHSPLPGARLMVLENTGGDWIRGEFANLAHGQIVILERAGIFHPFVANYFGGDGNDLMLEWTNTRPAAWGGNQDGQLGTGNNQTNLIPIAVANSGVLSGKTIIAASAGEGFNLALCSDGTVASWGRGYWYGQLGNNITSSSNLPVRVDTSGVLAGKTVVAVATGIEHALALCSDGTLATWGNNDAGQLGNGSTAGSSPRPVAVDQSGVLAGRKVVAIAAGSKHNVVLCADGSVFAWGENHQAQLGNGTTTASSVPVRVNLPDFLTEKTARRLSAGGRSNFILYSDGTLVGWGANQLGQLGLGFVSESSEVVRTASTGALAGKTIIDLSTGGGYSVALCSDGTLASWGVNHSGYLGNNSTNNSAVPVAVVRTGALAGKAVVALSSGGHTLVRSSDDTLAAWGWNFYGGVGNNTEAHTLVPATVNSTILKPGERFGKVIAAGSNHSLAVVASPAPPVAETLAATAVGDARSTVNARVHPNGLPTTVSFEYGLTPAYGSTVQVAAPLSGTGTATAAAAITGLLTDTLYHFRVVVTNTNGTWRGGNMTFTTNASSTLIGLTTSAGTLVPGFAPVTTTYAVTVPSATQRITVTPTAALAEASLAMNGSPAASGVASGQIELSEGDNEIRVVVTAPDGINTQTYTLIVTRVPERIRFDSPDASPVRLASLKPSGALGFDLGFHPQPGTVLTAIRQAGLSPVDGFFDNLTHGQRVILSHEGVTYDFVADYFGGDGNDLVLHWSNSRLFGWGANGSGALGIPRINTNSRVERPTPANPAAVLDGRVITRIASGGGHTLLLFADGTPATIGSNDAGQLGTPAVATETHTPVIPVLTGVLAGRTVVAIDVGLQYSVALCSDGTLATWGSGANGKLGNNGTTNSTVPVEVDRSGVLAGRRVVAVAAGREHCLALCEDGGVVAWGRNQEGQLGDGTQTSALVPVAVDATGVLAGRKVVAIRAGTAHSLALCDDGTIATWGINSSAQLGIGTTTRSTLPVAVVRDGIPAGPSVTALAAGGDHNLLLLDDGRMVGWGSAGSGQLVISSNPSRILTPTLIPAQGALSGREAVAITAGWSFSLVRCSDNMVAAFGSNMSRELGAGITTTLSANPLAVLRDNLRPGERFASIATGSSFSSALALVAAPPAAAAVTLEPTLVRDRSVTLNGNVTANGSETAVRFEFGTTPAYGTTLQANPATVGGVTASALSVDVAGLVPGQTYHFRVVADGPGGTVVGEDRSFTTTTLATLGGLSIAEATLSPAFESTRTGYVTTVPFAVDGVSVTPVVNHPTATVEVDGHTVESAVPGLQSPLAVGTNTLTIEVTSGDGHNTMVYQIVVTRLPERLEWPAASHIPVVADGFLATGDAPPLALGHAPQTGATLTLVNNTSDRPIAGSFTNLARGQLLELEFAGVRYPFIVSYTGGDGNDLTLEWGSHRMVAWGWNSQGQLGEGTLTNSLVPIPLAMTGGLAGRQVIDVKAGFNHSLALTNDGDVWFWGRSSLGTDGSGAPSFPTLVQKTGALEGRTVIAIAAGERHNLALCSDGTLAAWGYNHHGQLGNNGSATATVPVEVDRSGALAGKEIVAIGAGRGFSVALCSDGTVAAWGWLSGSQQPAQVFRTPVRMEGALLGRKAVKLAAGYNNFLALCDDGTLIVWGSNNSGEFGNGTTGQSDTRLVPAVVARTGALAGKTIRDMAVGSGFITVLCSDGSLAAWGNNFYGQLGNGNKTNSATPVAVNPSGALAGKEVVGVFSGQSQNFALCRDGTLAGWGGNQFATLGNHSTVDSIVPVEVSRSGFTSGERFAIGRGPGSAYNHGLALTALPPAPGATTLAASAITDTGARLHAEIRPNQSTTQVWFEYGRNLAYGTKTAAVPATTDGNGVQSVALPVGDLVPGTTYHFRVIATNAGGTVAGQDATFTTTTQAILAGLSVSEGSLTPAFGSAIRRFSVTVPATTTGIGVTAQPADPAAEVTINGTAGTSSDISLTSGVNTVPITVTSADGGTSITYQLTVTRLPDSLRLSSHDDNALTAPAFDPAGKTLELALDFMPETGKSIALVRQTGISRMRSAFDYLPQGAEIILGYGSRLFPYVVNYHGGDGNDLVLEWANTRLAGWGLNTSGQLGDATTSTRSSPVWVNPPGVLDGRTVVQVATGSAHTMALCADGTLATWGDNGAGQLGIGESVGFVNKATPVDVSGALAGKSVVAIAASFGRGLLLCDDGTLVGLGLDSNDSPATITETGDLQGREVVAISGGQGHFLALCSDGSVAAWGDNSLGQLGNGTINDGSQIPTLVGENSILEGRRVAVIAAGPFHNLVLCEDGGLVAWGANNAGQLGDGTRTNRPMPIAVPAAGALAGRTPVSIAASGGRSTVVCSDGAIVAWGINSSGRLGDGTTTERLVPVQVFNTGILAGKSPAMLSVGSSHSHLLTTDGTLAGWGANGFDGLLGTGISSSFSNVPVATLNTLLPPGGSFSGVWSGPLANHTIARIALATPAIATTGAATDLLDQSAMLNGTVLANGSGTEAWFEVWQTGGRRERIPATPGNLAANAPQATVTAALSGLLTGTTYHFRMVAANDGGIRYGEARSFTTSTHAALADLTAEPGALTPSFDMRTGGYLVTLPHATTSISLTPRALDPEATIRVNGASSTSGVPAPAVSLAVGNNAVPVEVRSADGRNTQTYQVMVTRLPETFTFADRTTVPVTTERFVATGTAPEIHLAFAPSAGTSLTLVRSTGRAQIVGEFDNLAHGQSVELDHGGVIHPFVVNYHGGEGNDLVLEWANRRLLAWGNNHFGQLANGGYVDGVVPAEIPKTGALAGRTVLAVSVGSSHVLALCGDGSLAAWGANHHGQLGDGTLLSRNIPVAVDRSGALAGKRVVQLAAGSGFSMVLCSDGTLIGWGSNNIGQLGLPAHEFPRSTTPRIIEPRGALADRAPIAIGTGDNAAYAILDDGTIAAWGSNTGGQLGNDSTINSPLPVPVHRDGVLAGKVVVAVDGGVDHAVALCSDGTLVAWGDNGQRQLGTTADTTRKVPYRVDATGVLAGRTPVAVAAGSYHNITLCSDGSLITWGRNGASELGNGLPSSSTVPVAVLTSGVLAGKSPVAIATGGIHNIVLNRDNTLAAWGTSIGSIGDGVATASTSPVAVNRSAIRSGESILAIAAGSSLSHLLVASPPRSLAATLAASDIQDTRATLNAEIRANGSETRVSFDFGPPGGPMHRLDAVPATSSGVVPTTHTLIVGDLPGNTTYQFRAVSEGPGGTVFGETLTFTTTSKALLNSVQAGTRLPSPAFSPNRRDHAVTFGHGSDSTTITPVAAHPTATIRVNGAPVTSGTASAEIDLPVGDTTVLIQIDANDGINTREYQLTLTRLPAVLAAASPTSPPLTVARLMPAGLSTPVTLGFAPAPGTRIPLVNVTGREPIDGAFDNLPQGKTVFLAHGGLSYPFAIHYFGGDGNDLVLVPFHGRLLGWGGNSFRQLSPLAEHPIPTPRNLDPQGVFAGKALLDLASGGQQSLALFADGSLYQWRSNYDNPERIDGTGALAGRRVIAIASGGQHSLALCDDGTVAAWGSHSDSQLGDNATGDSALPVAINLPEASPGHRVIQVAAGNRHSLALRSDGSLVAWGHNVNGQLGDGTTLSRPTPVEADLSAIPAGRRIVSIRAGVNFNLALLDDGTLAGWGDNQFGQTGDGTTVNRSRPVFAGRPGLLNDKTIVAIATGGYHSAALCSDGTLATWGYNDLGRLGDGTETNRLLPVAIQGNGVLAGKSITAVSLGADHSLATTADGTLAAWGWNGSRALGTDTNPNANGFSMLPLLVSTGDIAPHESVARIAAGSSATSNLLHVATPPGPVGTTLAAADIQDASATLQGSVITNGNATRVTFEYGPSPDYGFTVELVDHLDGNLTGEVPVAAEIFNLRSGTTYHFRLRVDGPFGTTFGDDNTFTTTTRAALASLEMSSGSIVPAFQGALTEYRGTTPFSADRIRLRPVAATGTPTISVNGNIVPSGAESPDIPLSPGFNFIEVHVDADDGFNFTTYILILQRLPEALVITDPESAPLTVEWLTATGGLPPVTLGFDVPTGASLKLIDVTGDPLIEGEFANLPHGATILIDHGDTTWRYVADYAGGDGNDLVLHWANRRLLAWGSNFNGQLGNGTGTASLVPVPVDASGVLAGATVTRVTAGMTSFSQYGYSHAVTADGRVASWGTGDLGMLGNGGTANQPLPVWVDHSGALAGRKVVAIGTGAGHTVALCLDGGMVAWGYNNYSSQVGDGTTVMRTAPVNVRMTGELANRRVRAIAVGHYHNLALCEDGTLVGWGDNNLGQLGLGDTNVRRAPVIIPHTGVLVGRKIVRIAAGAAFSVALCEDGTIATWGANGQGQLGDGSTSNSMIPVAVNASSALAGRKVVEISCGLNHVLALCDDGSVIAWGNHGWGQLGTGASTSGGFGNSNPTPLAIDATGALAGVSLTHVAAARLGSLARSADGRLFGWGINDHGQLGDGTQTQRPTAVEISRVNFHPGETGLLPGTSSSAGSHALGLTALALPTASPLPADAITGVSATLRGLVNARGNQATVRIEYGPDPAFGTGVAAIPGTVTGSQETAVLAEISGLRPGTPYFYRIITESAGGITRSAVMSFTTLSDNARLADIVNRLSNRRPAFAPETFHYIASVDFDQDDLEMRPVTEHPGATVVINGIAVPRGDDSPRFPLAVGGNTLEVVVTAEDGITTLGYTTVVTRLPEFFDLTPGAPPVTAPGFSAKWRNARLRLTSHPPVGTSLTVVENTSLSPIHGEFENLKQGQRITLGFDGVDHDFIANYYGGSGNDLVLHWADNFVAAWGLNNHGQLGNGGTVDQAVPVVAERADGRTVFAVAAGYLHSVALLHDGTLAAWGYNVQGQLGLGHQQPSQVATPVVSGGALAGKTVVAIAAGAFHNLALCGDGTVVSWGSNNHGQLGTGDRVMRNAPVVVEPVGALAGKRVVAVAAGYYHSLALCDDGSVAGWGYNDEGELGNGGTTTALIPVAVDVSGSLAGKRVSRIAAGQYHSLALCTDGTLVAWGYNGLGRIGDGTTTDRHSPVEVDLTGAAGRIAAGGSHSLVELVDGTLWGWGDNSRGQLAAGLGERITMPQVLAAGSGRGFSCGALHSLSVRDGEWIDVWGDARAATAAVVSATGGGFTEGSRFVSAASGASAFHHLAIVAVPNPAGVPALAAWREWHFGTAANEGEAADCEDCDRDGIPNLVEYAFGLDPNADSSGQLPQPRLVGDRLELRFKRTLIKPDVEIGAEWSPDLQPGSWQAVPDSGGGEAVFSLPLDAAPRLFMRIKVTPTQSP